MKQRNWVLIALGAIGFASFLLSRTVWGPPSKALAAEPPTVDSAHVQGPEIMSEAERRYIDQEPRHWRYVMLKHD
jgi:hypothetical protein